MGQCLTIVSVEAVEAHFRRVGDRSRIAESPLPEAARGVSGVPEHLGQRVRTGFHRHLSFRIGALVAAYVGVTRMLSRHQRGSRGSRNGGAGVALRECHALICQLLEVWRADQPLSVGADVADTEVVGEDENDVGTLLLPALGRLTEGLTCEGQARQRAGQLPCCCFVDH